MAALISTVLCEVDLSALRLSEPECTTLGDRPWPSAHSQSLLRGSGTDPPVSVWTAPSRLPTTAEDIHVQMRSDDDNESTRH